jgi:hypothetical protein
VKTKLEAWYGVSIASTSFLERPMCRVARRQFYDIHLYDVDLSGYAAAHCSEIVHLDNTMQHNVPRSISLATSFEGSPFCESIV